MGYKDRRFKKDLHQQVYDKFQSMLAIGESKRLGKEDGTYFNKIYSYDTYNTYYKHSKYFVQYLKQYHPEVTNLKHAKKYVPEFLQSRCDQVDKNGKHLSAWTIATETQALNKLFQIRVGDKEWFEAPTRHRHDIERSRDIVKSDAHFSEKNNAELIKFVKCTGTRRSELTYLKGKSALTREEVEAKVKELQEPFAMFNMDKRETLKAYEDALKLSKSDKFVILVGKGGRFRVSPIISKDADQIYEKIMNTPKDKRVFEYVHKKADIHSYRSEYACAIYKDYARNIEDIPYDRVNRGTGRMYQSAVYTCRKDEAGRQLDRDAMEKCSIALGHNRPCIVADNYLRGI